MRIKLVQDVIDKLRGKNKKKKLSVLKKKYLPPKQTYKHLVCLQGFGHSGSGAVLDLLSEFNNVTAFGYHDKNGSLYNKASCGEIDFIRRYGGLLDLESAFETKNSNIRDYKLKNFITLMEFYYRKEPWFNDKIMALTENFINSLVDFKLQTQTGCESNSAFMFKEGFGNDYENLKTPFLFQNKKPRFIYYLKDMSVEEYRSIAKMFLKNCLNEIESKKYLVLDQFVSDGNADFEKLREYLGEYKHIAVYRDPRDVYATGILEKEEWMPQNPEMFVKWYNYHTLPYIHVKHKDYMLIKFENLVLKYDEIVPEILKFVGLEDSEHVRKKQYFDPSVSVKNIGIYKKCNDIKAIEYIRREIKYD